MLAKKVFIHPHENKIVNFTTTCMKTTHIASKGCIAFLPSSTFTTAPICTKVQVHNNLAEAVKLCLVNINRKFFHLLKQRKFDKLDVDLGVLSFIQNNERRI